MISEAMTKAQHEAVARAMRNTRLGLAESICWALKYDMDGIILIEKEELKLAVEGWYKTFQDHAEYCRKHIQTEE